MLLVFSGMSGVAATWASSVGTPSQGDVIPPWQYPINPSNTPTTLGCFKYDASQSTWIREPCLPPSVSSHIPRPQEGAKAGVTGEASKGLINYGYVDVFADPKYGWKDSVQGSGGYSIQANTNGFPVSGNTYAVQFTLQNLPGGGAYLCIWTIDVTTQSYPNDCQSIPNIPLTVADEYMNGWAYGGNLGIQFCENDRTTCWYNLESDSIGLESHWKGLTGTALGYGGGSQLIFLTGPKQSTINVQIGMYKPSKPYVAGEIGASTLETNNLHYTSRTSPTCSSDWCTMWTYSKTK